MLTAIGAVPLTICTQFAPRCVGDRPSSLTYTGGARPSMSDADEYSSDDDGHIHDDFEPQVDPTLSVDVGSGLSVRPEDCLFRPLRDQRLSRPPRSPTSFPALDLPRLPRPNLAEP